MFEAGELILADFCENSVLSVRGTIESYGKLPPL